MRLRIRLLGGLAVEGVAERDLGSRKARTVLKVLALARGRPVPVDTLADALWGDDQPSRPGDQVGVLVSRLRGVLGADRLRRSDAGYALVADWLDVDELDQLAATAGTALGEGRPGAARAAATAALALARGPLLPEEDGMWVQAERAAATAAVARARAVAIDAAVAAGDHGSAAALAETALARDPYDEAVLRALMRAHLAAGRRASALGAYARVRARLRDDLGVPPTAETEALHAIALGADADLPPPRGGRSRPPPTDRAFVGRGAELAALDRALVQAAAGAGILVLVEGEAGIGKSTLVDRWTAGLEHSGVVVLSGRCDELGRDLPLQPVGDALAEHLRAVGAERAAAIVGPDGETLAPLLGPVGGSAATMLADAATGRMALFAALAAAIIRSRDKGPVVLVVEDLHLAGGLTTAWLAFARRRCPEAVFLVTSRVEAPALPADLVLRLEPLEVDDVAELVGPERAPALHARSGGHPLLLAALVAAGGGGDLPASVREAVAVRVNALGEEAAATIRVAAVLGLDCDVDLIAQVREVPSLQILPHLEAAAQVGLVVEAGAGFRFAHELVRDALDAAAGTPRRAVVHREAARVLAVRPGADPLAVAVHAGQGGNPRLAASSYVAAAEAAAARYDLVTAEEHLGRALALDETPAAYVARARVRMRRLALDEAADDASRAVASGGGPAALEVAGWVAYYQRRYDDAGTCADQVVEVARDPALRASALALAGRVRHGAGDLAGALAHLTAPTDGAPLAVRGVGDVWLAQLRLHQGRPLDALAVLARPLVAGDALAHPWAPLHLRFNRVMALGQLGRVAEGLAVSDDLAAAVARSGEVGARFLAPAANVRAWVLRWSGRGGEADEANLRALEATGGAAGPSREPLAEGHYVALLDLADGCIQRGAPEAAAGLVARLDPVDSWSGTMAWHQRHRLGLLRARLALLAGDADRAAALATGLAADAAGRGAGRYEVLAGAVLGLADRTMPVERLDAVVEGIGRCAVLDGWPLVVALAADRGVDRWQQAAHRLIGRVVAQSAGQGEAVRRLADSQLARITG